jgi:hypothetical protein
MKRPWPFEPGLSVVFPTVLIIADRVELNFRGMLLIDNGLGGLGLDMRFLGRKWRKFFLVERNCLKHQEIPLRGG